MLDVTTIAFIDKRVPLHYGGSTPMAHEVKMANNRDRDVLQIKKYPNRRYYDAIHSRHVTLKEIHDLIAGGQDVSILDSRSGEDITNLVLTQILLEQDRPKLDIFPTSWLHSMIRSNRQDLRSSLERIFGPFLGLMATTQKQFDAYLREAKRGHSVTPFDWAQSMMMGVAPGGTGRHDAGREDYEATEPAPASDEPSSEDETLDDLRRQVANLTRLVEQLGARRDSGESQGL